MIKELETIGLSEKEARVYAAALELGPTTAEKLATHSKVNRSTTYVQLETLMEKGLMSTFEEGKKTYFAPESPELLKRLLEHKRDQLSVRERELNDVLPDLLRQFEGAGERPVVRFFSGKEGIRTAREEMLVLKKKEIVLFFSASLLSELYTPKELEEYSRRRKKLRIRTKGIYLQEIPVDYTFLDSLTERRFMPPDALPLTIDIAAFDDKVAIFSLKGNQFALIIESKQIAASVRAIFEFFWKHAKRLK